MPRTNFHLYANNPVEKYFWGRLPINHAAAVCHFTTGSLVQRLLHQLKYKGNRDIGAFLGKMMGRSLSETDRFSDVDVLVPLPLFAAREKKRGYNQSEILCNGMSSILKWPVDNRSVVRLTSTETQTHKTRTDRWSNMEGRFQVAGPAALEGKHVLLIDDVITTGATLEACGQEILKVSRTKLSIATLAYTV